MNRTTMRNVAWAEICKLGDAERAADPTLSVSKARVRAMHTTKGREWRNVYDDSDSHLSPDLYVAKKDERARLATLGAPSWEGVASKLAREFITARAADRTQPRIGAMEVLKYGRAMVQKHCPDVHVNAQAERGR